MAEPSNSPIGFDLTRLAIELDKKSRPARFTGVLLPVVMIGLSLLFFAIFFVRIRSGTLDPAGWAGLAVVWGFTLLIWAGDSWNLHYVWHSRRAAVHITVDRHGVEISYPEGTISRISWSDHRLLFRLVDLTQVGTPRGTADSTCYIISDSNRHSAIPVEAFRLILIAARMHGVVTTDRPRGSLFFPNLVAGSAWTVWGR